MEVRIDENESGSGHGEDGGQTGESGGDTAGGGGGSRSSDGGNAVGPSWLARLLGIEFYANTHKCDKHTGNYLTWYCKDCTNEPPFCLKCKGSRHKKHDVLQVVTASRKPAIKKAIISKFWDATDIQEFTMNGEKVIYLHTRKTIVSQVCRMYEAHQIESQCPGNKSSDLFCSIECRMNHDSNSDMSDSIGRVGGTKAEVENAVVREEVVVEGLHARRRRKGVPRRSHLN